MNTLRSNDTIDLHKMVYDNEHMLNTVKNYFSIIDTENKHNLIHLLREEIEDMSCKLVNVDTLYDYFGNDEPDEEPDNEPEPEDESEQALLEKLKSELHIRSNKRKACEKNDDTVITKKQKPICNSNSKRILMNIRPSTNKPILYKPVTRVNTKYHNTHNLESKISKLLNDNKQVAFNKVQFADQLRNGICFTNENCNRPGCNRLHFPNTELCPTMMNGIQCTSAKCSYIHLKSCNYDEACSNTSCTFLHSYDMKTTKQIENFKKQKKQIFN